MPYKYLLFDADNTLFDFGLAEFHAFRETCRLAGIDWSEEAYKAYSAINDALWKKLERGETTQAELKIQRYREFLEWYGYTGDSEDKAVFMGETYKVSLGRQAFLMPDAEEVLAVLSARGYRISIVTNGISQIQRARMASSPLQKYVTDLYISEELGVAKPDPAFFDAVFADIGDTDRKTYLVIGDSLSSDIDGAIASGLDCVWFSPKTKFSPKAADAKGRKPTYTVQKLPELLSIL